MKQITKLNMVYMKMKLVLITFVFSCLSGILVCTCAAAGSTNSASSSEDLEDYCVNDRVINLKSGRLGIPEKIEILSEIRNFYDDHLTEYVTLKISRPTSPYSTDLIEVFNIGMSRVVSSSCRYLKLPLDHKNYGSEYIVETFLFGDATNARRSLLLYESSGTMQVAFIPWIHYELVPDASTKRWFFEVQDRQYFFEDGVFKENK